MSGINSFNCSSFGANTGGGNCALVLGKVMGFFLVPKSFEIKDDEFTDTGIIDALKEASEAAVFSNRIFPVHGIADVADNSAEDTQQTLGYGPIVTVQEGNYSWTFTLLGGGVCLQKKLRKFNGGNYATIFYDENGVLFGQKVGTSLKGVPLVEFHAGKWGIATGTTIMSTTARFVVNPTYLNEKLGFYKLEDTSLRFEDVVGLQDVNLSVAAHVGASLVFNIKATTGCDGEDLYDAFSTELADVTLWKAVNAATGADVTITSVTANPSLKAFTVTLDSDDADKPATGGSIVISLKSPADLAAKGVIGYEGQPLKTVV